ncbi:MAG: metallophosphoesterase [Polyangiaceae bacterium]|nr:metallophosphoesterase [Polyangiaceae bacterium]
MPWSARSLGLIVPCLAGCMELSPFQIDLPAHQRDKTAENLARLGQRPPPALPWRFAVVTDNHQAYDELASVVDELNARDDLELVLHGGDLSDVGLKTELVWSLEELERLRVPWFTVVGNHDALSNGKQLYASMFGPEDYAFEHGSVRFVCFNSNEHEYSGTPRLTWLADAVRGSSTQSTVALTHVPPDALAKSYEQTLVDNQVALALSGHFGGFELRQNGGTSFVRVDAVMSERWAEVTVGLGGSLALAACERSGCAPLGGGP